VQSIAAHGKLTGLVLTLLPFGVVAVMLWVNSSYFDPLLAHPLGKNLIFAALIALVLAHLIIQRIVDIEI
jgi:tight adherence protein B